MLLRLYRKGLVRSDDKMLRPCRGGPLPGDGFGAFFKRKAGLPLFSRKLPVGVGAVDSCPLTL